MNSSDPFELSSKTKKERQPLTFNQMALAVMIGTLCAQEIRGLFAFIVLLLQR